MFLEFVVITLIIVITDPSKPTQARINTEATLTNMEISGKYLTSALSKVSARKINSQSRSGSGEDIKRQSPPFNRR